MIFKANLFKWSKLEVLGWVCAFIVRTHLFIDQEFKGDALKTKETALLKKNCFESTRITAMEIVQKVKQQDMIIRFKKLHNQM